MLIRGGILRKTIMLGLLAALGNLCFCGAAQAQSTVTRPYTCGFVLESKAAIGEVYGPELAVLDLHAGDVIADIGGSNGYRMGMFAALHDSLRIYVQDIDSLCLNTQELDAVRAYYAEVKGGPLQSTFEMVIGDTTATHLPAATFDKVLVTVAFHHFAQPAAMMHDIASKLKPGGRIYLIENVVRRTGQRRRRLCDDPLMTATDLVATFVALGFEVEAVQDLGRWWTKMFVLHPKLQQP